MSVQPNHINAAIKLPSYIEKLAKFEETERKRLGLEKQSKTKHWRVEKSQGFYSDERDDTTILLSGLTMAHDSFVQAGLEGLGYKAKVIDIPDHESFQYGKEFGSRAQCNPAYFTVGNLIKYLTKLRDEKGMSPEEIINKHVFLTAGARGPCRFGMYVTEYRKALRDAGFEGFRIVLFHANGGLNQATGREVGLKMDREFYLMLGRAIVAGDVLNAMMYRIRPYETVKGNTDKAIAECREVICHAFQEKRSILMAMSRCRKILEKIEVDRTLVKPKVSLIGEFWAMTTEGDGNYRLQRFLEEEGAEVDVQPITNWLLYNIWQARVDMRRRMTLRAADMEARKGLKTTQIAKKFMMIKIAEWALKGTFYSFAKVLGLKNHHLPDIEENATVAQKHYHNDLRGGEGHMEVGKVIQSVLHNKCHMVLSIKPFGCMPSSGVSDGIQTIVTELYPEAIFLPIETTGDSAVNVYSRIQMMLFKAKRLAEKEYESLLEKKGLTDECVKRIVSRIERYRKATYHSPHRVAGTAANFLLDAV